MPSSRVLLPIVLLALTPGVSRAQLPDVSPERRTAVLESGRLLNSPAEFVLQHRNELALTDAQVTSLERLAGALRDSSAARGTRLVQLAQQIAEQTDLAAAMEWTGPVDESAVREVMRRQSTVQAEVFLAARVIVAWWAHC